MSAQTAEIDAATKRALQVVIMYENTKLKPVDSLSYKEEDFYIIKFSYGHGSWKAFVGSDAFKTVYYEVDYNFLRNQTTVEIYHRIGKFTVNDEEFVPEKRKK